MRVYGIYNTKEGFMCEDEDLIGVSYNFHIDEYTLLFKNKADAEFNKGKVDEVVEVDISEDFKSELLI